MIDAPQDSLLQTIIALLGGGAIVGWVRERRKGRKDTNSFALALIEAQNLRIDGLLFQVGELSGKVAAQASENARLLIENTELKNQLVVAQTALRSELEKVTALAARNAE